MSAAQLILGSVDLLGMDGYEALGDDGSWGSPQPIDVTLQSLLQDGSVVVTQGYDNREVSLRVRLTGSDSAELASLESTLFAEVGKRNTLTYVPPDGWGPASVFEVVTSRLEHTLDDVAEVMSCERTYGLTLVCEPFARSADQFTVVGATVSDPAPTPPPPTTITDGVSGTNWTVHTAKPTTYGGVAFSTNPILQLGYNKRDVKTTHVYEYTATFSVGQQKYLAIDWDMRGEYASMSDISPAVMLNNAANSTTGGTSLLRVGQMASPTNPGYTRTLWAIPSSIATVTRIRITSTMQAYGPDATWNSYERGIAVRLIQLTSQPLSSGTARQKTMTITVPGSAPTVGSLQVSHSTTALGDLLAYSWADSGCGYTPPMRGFRVSGGTLTVDSSAYSGAYDSLGAPVTYERSTQQVPMGLYVIYARLRLDNGASATVQIDASTLIGGNQLPGSAVTSKQLISGTIGAWKIVPIGRMMLPTVDAGSNGTLRLVVSNGGPSALSLDEIYLCNATIGRATVVNAGTLGTTPTPGAAPSTIWINSPTTDSPRPSVTAGVATDGSDAYNIESLVSSSQPHRWEPPSVSVFTACNALDATTTLTGYPRWHTHAADDQAA